MPRPNEAEDAYAVRVTALSHRYGSRIALQNVTFAVRTGEIFGVLGPNGGGKSTMFRVLSTMMPATEGS
ncbi:MAG TPA: ATP-binding cassette domain-containing protein, partial [Candidatus Eisenbacteria bacterium]|nr:ATP-binding cassette domain-containing protein [Candidatus Eisenbacteria bacterium]